MIWLQKHFNYSAIMKYDKILGKVLALTKQIYIKKPENVTCLQRSFLAGRKEQFPLMGSIGLEWWLAKDGISLLEDLANMAMSSYPELRGGDTSSFCKTIEDTLRENALNSEIFDGDTIFLRKANTLFDARSVPGVNEFALTLWNKIHQSLIRSMVHWIILYPLYRVKVQTTALDADGITLLSSEDRGTWESICEKYSNGKVWDLSSGRRKDGLDSFFKKAPPTWLLCEVYGTDTGARTLAGGRMRTFISVLFSHLHDRFPNLLTKSMAEEMSYSLQFPKNGSLITYGQVFASIGRLFPPLSIDIDISQEDLLEVKKWYVLRSSAPAPNMQRVTTASHFINYAIVANHLERFIHFFIALDALFGERDRVEETIIDGIKRSFPDDLRWVDRARRLFDLRSELVHGGSSRIEDWKGLDHYRRYFKSHPLTDVGIAAMKTLRNYFDL